MKAKIAVILLLFAWLQTYSYGNDSKMVDIDKLDQLFGSKEVCISDGSSVYVFSPVGEFHLEPLGMSGRTIEGSWKRDGHVIHITGKWEWINGISSLDDFRVMQLSIGSLSLDAKREHISVINGSKRVIYDCYFTIEKLEKRPK